MAPPASVVTKLKVQLKLAIARLRMVQQRDEAMSKTQRRAMAQLLEVGKIDSARIRVENIIRSDITTELHEILELYCELLIARAGLLEGSTCDPGLEEAVKSIIYAANKTEIKELQVVRTLLVEKYGKEFVLTAMDNLDGKVSEKVVKKLSVTPPKEELVIGYLEEIAKAYNVDWPKRSHVEPPADLLDDDAGDDDDTPSGGIGVRIPEGPLGNSAKVAEEQEELSKATPPRTIGGPSSPLTVTPPRMTTDNVHPKVTLNSLELKPSKKMDAATQKKAGDKGPGGSVPDITELERRFAALKRSTKSKSVITGSDLVMLPEMEYLGVSPDEFSRLSQTSMEEKLDEYFPRYMDDHKLLDTYTKWLVKQIPDLGLDRHSASSRIVRRCCDFLSSRNYDKGVVIGAFSRHKEMYVREHPTKNSIRQFNFTRRDIEINYKKLPPPSWTSATSSAGHFSDVSRERVDSVRDVCPSPARTGSSIHRLGDEAALEKTDRLLVRLNQLKSGVSPAKMLLSQVPTSKQGNPPANYVCNRCGIGGHWIQNCGTNGDPVYDGEPPRGYICRRCGAVEDHFITGCTGNQLPHPYPSIPTGLHDKWNFSSVTPKSFLAGSDPLSIVKGVRHNHSTSPGSCSMERNKREPEYSNPAGTAEYATLRRGSNDDHMNEERARFVKSHTDRYRPSPCKLGPIEGGGPIRSGSNTDPIGRRRQLDSYRPEPNWNERSGKGRLGNDREAWVSYRRPKLVKSSSDGRLSPWDDIHRPSKKRCREESSDDGGLPWDDDQTPANKRARDHLAEPPPKNSNASDGNSSAMSDGSEVALGQGFDEVQDLLHATEDEDWATAAADSLLETLEREWTYHSYSFKSETAEKHGYSEASPSSSVDFGEDFSSPIRPVVDDDKDTRMANDLGEVESSASIREMSRVLTLNQAIKPYQTLKPFTKNTSYHPCVLGLFRGRENANEYVNVRRLKAAMEMYEVDQTGNQ